MAPRNSLGVEQNTYGGLLDGGEHTSGLNHILGTSLTPFNVSGVPPESRQDRVSGWVDLKRFMLSELTRGKR